MIEITWICVGTVCSKINADSCNNGHTERKIRITNKSERAGSI